MNLLVKKTIQITSFLTLVTISLHVNKQMAITWPYKLLSTFLNHHFTCHTRPIKTVYKQIMWDKIAIGYSFLLDDDSENRRRHSCQVSSLH